ncbi:MAG: penicillin acylase family protein, partial [Cyclobacteriaceae bacterium]|nr:penicillin acylase family protein [Cyclobacteriaceae bacterium]
MKYIRFLFAVSLLLYGLYFLGKRQTIAGNTVPPLAMFLDPFHGFLQNAEKKEYPFETLIERSTLKNKVSVFYDSLNIPHLFAENDDDLYFAQGYVIAQHRLWQMEFQTLAAAGRVSEIIGNKGLSFDRTQRRIGMVKGAKATFEEFNK